MGLIEDKLGMVGLFVVRSLQTELKEQGHDASGSLLTSIENELKTNPDGFEIVVTFNDYGKFVNEGRRDGGKKVPISVLMEWIERKGIATGQKEIKNAAFAIQRKIEQEGIPTKNSFKFTNNGRRAGFVDFVINNELVNIFKEVEEAIFLSFSIDVENLINKANKKLS